MHTPRARLAANAGEQSYATHAACHTVTVTVLKSSSHGTLAHETFRTPGTVRTCRSSVIASCVTNETVDFEYLPEQYRFELRLRRSSQERW